MNAHFIDVGQANATLLEFQCGVVLIDAGADQEHGEALVEFLNRFFDDRPALQRTIKLVLITHNHIDHTMALDSVVKNFKVERYIDHRMLEGRGTENPNWIRDEVAEGHRQITIREIKDSAGWQGRSLRRPCRKRQQISQGRRRLRPCHPTARF